MMSFSKLVKRSKKSKAANHKAFKNVFYQTSNRCMLVERLERREVFDAGWTVSIEGTYLTSSTNDSSGNILMSGHFTNAAPFGNTTLQSSGTRDTFVAKQNPNDSFVWAIKAGNATSDEDRGSAKIVTDANGDVYIAGYFVGTAQFGSTTLVSAGFSDAYVAKLSGATGQFLWVKQFGGANNDVNRTLSIDSLGDIIVAGSRDADPSTLPYAFTSPNYAITKLNANGDVIWEKSLTSTATLRVHDVEVGADNSIYVGGDYGGTMSLSTGELVAGSTRDGLLLKLDSVGDITWAKSLNGDTTRIIRDVAVSADNKLYVVGALEGGLNFDGISKVSVGPQDYFVAQFNATTAATQWVERFGSNQADPDPLKITVAPNGNVDIAFSVLSGNVTFGSIAVPGVAGDTILTSLSSTGTHLTSSIIVSGYARMISSLHYDGAGTLYTTGHGLPASAGISNATHTPHRTVSVSGGFVTKLPPRASTKFYVVDESAVERTYNYSASGELTVGQFSTYDLPNSTIRGAASNASGSNLWLGERSGYVLNYSTSGAYLGSWRAGSLGASPVVEGIATNGTDMWIVDNTSDKVFRYTGAASRVSGTQNAVSSFKLNASNKNPKGIMTDGTNIWVVDDATTDKIFKYTMTGALVGSWIIDSANKSPTGLTLDPTNGSQHIWVVDNGTDKIYQYNSGRSRNSGSQAAAAIFALAVGNTNPQGIADPPPPGTDIASDNSSASSSVQDFDGIPADLIDKALSKGIASSTAEHKAAQYSKEAYQFDQPVSQRNTSITRGNVESKQTGSSRKTTSCTIDEVFADLERSNFTNFR